MSVLKKGSKGPEVKQAQELLNKVGAKPKLNVDGDFGKLTDKQTRDMQGKLKVKVDGKIGDNTLAALKHGKALPALPEIDSRITDDAKHPPYAIVMRKSLKAAEKEFQTLVQTTSKAFVELNKMLDDEVSIGEKRVAAAKDIVSKTAEFEKAKSKNPGKAETLANEVNKLADTWYKLNISGHNWRPTLDKEIANMTKCLKTLKGF